MTEKTQRKDPTETQDDLAPGVSPHVPGHVQRPAEAPSEGEPGAEPEPAAISEEAPSSIPPDELERLHSDLVAALKTVFDPEIPVDIYELGLIYKVEIDDDRNVEIEMTLTAPGCPVAGDMPGWVENAVSAVPGVGQVRVNLTFDPPWDLSRMSDEARLALNMF
jgi:FeS assembly SUF system protein